MLVVFFKQESAYELRISDWSSDVCSSDLYDIPICTNYGATEFAGAIAGWTIDDFRKHWTEKRGSVGRVHANIAARVVDTATGAALPAGEDGLHELQGEKLGIGLRWLRTTARALSAADHYPFNRGPAATPIT